MRSILRRTLALLLAAAVLPLSGCAQPPEPAQTTIFAMDTVMNLTVYGPGSDAEQTLLLNQMVDILYELDGTLDVTDEESDIYALNHANGVPTPVSQSTADLLRSAQMLCQTTGGTLDITAYPAVSAWGFTTGNYRVPPQEELDKLAQHIDYTKLSVDRGQTVTLPAGMALDTGAVAKGYAGDWLKEQLVQNKVTSALLDLGQSSIQTVGAKPDGTPWRIGIQDPNGEGYLGVLELSDQAMGTSGSYQRYFEENGVRYCHIIDPESAAPAQSGLASVTVVSNSCMVCDGLSTALFAMGLEDAILFWNRMCSDPVLAFEAIFIGEDGSISITSGLEDAFSLDEGYADREVTVIR